MLVTDIILLEWDRAFELLVSWADEYQHRYILVSYEAVAALRVMFDTDQLNIQYHNYSKSWCNIFQSLNAVRTLQHVLVYRKKVWTLSNLWGYISHLKTKPINCDGARRSWKSLDWMVIIIVSCILWFYTVSTAHFHFKLCRVYPQPWKVLREEKTQHSSSSFSLSLLLRENCLLFLWQIMRLILFSLIFIQNKRMVCVSVNTYISSPSTLDRLSR